MHPYQYGIGLKSGAEAMVHEIQAEILALMDRLKRETGTAVMFITHDMAVVAQMADRVVVMFRGEKVEEGPVTEIFENPQHPYTRKLMAAVPIPDPARRGIRRGQDVEELKSPVRPVGYMPPKRQYQEVSAGHLVQLAG